jgi:glycosyltransferase involved in cell wall biosynthesis
MFFNPIQSDVNKPKVSIITSVYNGDQFISNFMEDITKQTIFDQCELIMINANSPGNEENIIKRYMKIFPNIIYLKLGDDPGLYAVWNMAIKMAKGEYIMNANLDDASKHNAIEVHAHELDQNPHIDLVYAGYLITNNPNETFEKNSAQRRCFLKLREFSIETMTACTPGPRPMWRKSMHERFGYFDETFKLAGDLEMWLRAVSLGAKFKKIGRSSYHLFYDNPNGISKNLAIEKKERIIINKRYEKMWAEYNTKSTKHYYCTIGDSNSFNLLNNLIKNILEIDLKDLGEIAIFDLGLTDHEIYQLKKNKKINIYQVKKIGENMANNINFEPIIIKQALDMFQYVLFIEPGTMLPKSLYSIFTQLKKRGYYLVKTNGNQINTNLMGLSRKLMI